ncbi:unnamed protein product [Litomosoides sigmodontis]|uniref:Uncharacterized protein n=1 Tax=Litomosoides sigmodontis TaxID=42156 RepID=A0A3P6TPW0_LITSI|nr:unnamed protein product [Litomosoides sigmodontis]
MALSVVLPKPKRYYLPLSLSFDDAEDRCKRWQSSGNNWKNRISVWLMLSFEFVWPLAVERISSDSRYFDAELFVHSTTAVPAQQSFIKEQHNNLFSQKEALLLLSSRLTSGINRSKQAESIPKRILPQQLRSLTLTCSNEKQMFQKCCHVESESVKCKKIRKNFVATKHVGLLSARDETGDNQIDFVDENCNRNYDMNSRKNSSANHFHEQRPTSTHRLQLSVKCFNDEDNGVSYV